MSRYSKLLTKIIADSGYMAKEVVDKCNEIGNGIDTTRLSKLQNGKLSAPSDKVSRDIARICKTDERRLVIEGYLEKAPKEIVDVFIALKTKTLVASLKIFENNITKEQLEVIKEALEKEPLSDLAVGILNDKSEEINITAKGFDIKAKDHSFSIEEPLALKVKDNSMFPLIPINSKVSLIIEEKYTDGNILAMQIKGQEDIIFRYALFNDDSIVITSLNQEFKPMTYNKKDVMILGRVSKIITNI